MIKDIIKNMIKNVLKIIVSKAYYVGTGFSIGCVIGNLLTSSRHLGILAFLSFAVPAGAVLINIYKEKIIS